MPRDTRINEYGACAQLNKLCALLPNTMRRLLQMYVPVSLDGPVVYPEVLVDSDNRASPQLGLLGVLNHLFATDTERLVLAVELPASSAIPVRFVVDNFADYKSVNDQIWQEYARLGLAARLAGNALLPADIEYLLSLLRSRNDQEGESSEQEETGSTK